jgi:signal transduction histidine kinase/CheY-like chemotaxis protein
MKIVFAVVQAVVQALVLTLLTLAGGPVVAAEAVAVVREAVFTALDPSSPDDAATPEQRVALPDTWRQRGLGTTGTGHYRLRFTLEASPKQPYGASFTRISSTRRVYLNGRLIEDTHALGYGHTVRAVIPLPPLLLRPGENEIALDVEHRIQGGLSAMKLGPMSAITTEEAHLAFRTDELPRGLNLATGLLALLMLLVRWRRPSEQAMGLFGGLALLGSVRNYSYFMEVKLLPVAVGDWVYFSAQVWTLALFAAFALCLQPDGRRPRVERAIAVAAVLLPVVAALTAPFGGLTLMRMLVYPVLLLGGIVSLAMLWRAMRHDRSAMNVALVAGFAVLMLSGVHDYLFQQGVMPVTGQFLIPITMPLAFGVYALMQLNRFVQAVNEVERLNLDLEHRVAERTRALQSANTAKTRFLAAASHDLRQPVAAIGLMVGLMREQVLAPALRKMIDRVDDALASMEALLKGLLDLSRLESGTVRARPERVPLQPLFDAIAVHETEAATRKGLRLRFRPTALAVRSDPVLLEQILRNLVSNAVRYTEAGTVLVAARARGDQVLLQVWDTGIGIGEADQAIVFDEFVQVGNRAREGAKGLGLGLSIVKRSAAVLGHPLHLRSRVGRGSCFALHVPRADDAVPVLRAASGPAQPLVGRRITVVDDDPAVLESLAERLRAWGAEVRAFDGVPALRASLPAAPSHDGAYADLLITDQRLPGGSGLLVVELVRQRCGPLPVLVVTGDTAPGDLALLEASGVPVLHKPFRTEALLAAIEAALREAPSASAYPT